MSRTRALLIGNNYVGTDNELNGCFADVQRMRDVLVSQGCVSADRVVMLLDATADQISTALQSLASASWSESLTAAYVHYSGHGTQVYDAQGDEPDGLDEAICPIDFAAAGVMTDDFLKRCFGRFNPATTVRFLCDACHSGSMLDLRYTYESATSMKDAGVRASMSPRVIMISGCRDTQTSADAWDAQLQQYGGALTDALLDVIHDDATTRTDVFALLAALRKRLRATGFTQVPVLSSSFKLASAVPFLSFAPKKKQLVQDSCPTRDVKVNTRKAAAGLRVNVWRR